MNAQRSDSWMDRLSRASWQPFVWLELALCAAGGVLIWKYRPLSYLGLAQFEERHLWIETTVFVIAVGLIKAAYIHFFRREQQRAEMAAYREELLRGRVKRMSLASRTTALLILLGLVMLGWLGPEREGRPVLLLAVPMFLLFALVEINITLRPGAAIFPNARDELLMFFKTRMLQAGYITAIVSLVAVFLVSLFAERYVGVLLPVALTVSLLVPAFVYGRLDRQAEADE